MTRKAKKRTLPAEVREMFRRWGAVGGKTRGKKLTADQRREQAKRASDAAAEARRKKAKRKPAP